MFLKDLNYAMKDEIGFEQVEIGEGALRGENMIRNPVWGGPPCLLHLASCVWP